MVILFEKNKNNLTVRKSRKFQEQKSKYVRDKLNELEKEGSIKIL